MFVARLLHPCYNAGLSYQQQQLSIGRVYFSYYIGFLFSMPLTSLVPSPFMNDILLCLAVESVYFCQCSYQICLGVEILCYIQLPSLGDLDHDS
jgi:hypothetical protein